MRTGHVVIGSNFGDEGKGLVTDKLAALATHPIVVRFNGGAQAGHTVHADGRRHVFHHVGSGTFAGATTYLAERFVCNPILFARERQALADLGVTPLVYVHPAAQVTTPFDMLINQKLEEHRGSARHGSCGVGFGETIARQEAGLGLMAAELYDGAALRARLIALRDQWVPRRLDALGLTAAAGDWEFHDDALIESFVIDCAAFLDAVRVAPLATLSQWDGDVLFEGAQGLGLDQDRRAFFPHVTRSSTGLFNVGAITEACPFDVLHVTYVTRPYVTRHGAGPLAHEVHGPAALSPRIVDRTNLPHPFQGRLRYGALDLHALAENIATDFLRAPTRARLFGGIALTCLDHIEDAIETSAGRLTPSALIGRLEAIFPVTLRASGPTRADVRVTAPAVPA